MKFARYIGIDYSGAQTPTSRLKALQVYEARSDTADATRAQAGGTGGGESRGLVVVDCKCKANSID